MCLRVNARIMQIKLKFAWVKLPILVVYKPYNNKRVNKIDIFGGSYDEYTWNRRVCMVELILVRGGALRIVYDVKT